MGGPVNADRRLLVVYLLVNIVMVTGKDHRNVGFFAIATRSLDRSDSAAAMQFQRSRSCRVFDAADVTYDIFDQVEDVDAGSVRCSLTWG